MGGDDRLRHPDAQHAHDLCAQNLDRMIADARSVLAEYTQPDATFVLGGMIMQQLSGHPGALGNAVGVLALAATRLAAQEDQP